MTLCCKDRIGSVSVPPAFALIAAPALCYLSEQAAAANKEDAALQAASKAAVDSLLLLKKELAEAEEA